MPKPRKNEYVICCIGNIEENVIYHVGDEMKN